MSQRRWVIAALVFLVIGLVALWRSKISMSQTQSVSLRGGASLAYAGVSYGRPEAIPPGENWKHAFSFLPKRALDKFNLTVSAKFPLATNNLMIWFQDFPSNSPFLIQVPNTIVGLADENGAECFAPNFFSVDSYVGTASFIVPRHRPCGLSETRKVFQVALLFGGRGPIAQAFTSGRNACAQSRL